jgi:putative CocE/NonD family hydrolase
MNRTLPLHMTASSVRTILIGIIVLLCGALGLYYVAKRVTRSAPWIEEDAMVTMRDGIRLHTKVWRPLQPGRYPVVLSRGYGPTGPAYAGPLVNAGYIYVGQATRGHGSSEGAHGVAERYVADGRDGYDTLTWIAQQPWSDGNIAMYGKSYWAGTQWLAAVEQHPNLKAIMPQVMNADLWQCAYHCNGALSLALAAGGRAFDKSSSEDIGKFGWDRFFRHLPLISLDEVVPGKHEKGATELWKQYVSHSTFDDYWQAVSLRGDGQDGKYKKITIPVYLMGGWYDYYAGAAFTSFQRLREAGSTQDFRIVINPSDHLNRIPGDRDFGSEAAKDELALATRWLDYVLKGIENGVKDEPPIRIFVMGTNVWRSEREWPLARTRFTKYYFHAEDGSRTGRLDRHAPGGELQTSYSYDPDNPVPTLGGNHSVIDRNLAGIIRAGAVDQRANETRPDVLVFTGAPLAEDLEVTGPIRMVLYAASSAPDTDFTAKLIDVYPDGTAYNLTEGIIRARFRKSVWEDPELLVPGRIYEYTLDLHPTSNVFLSGHSVRVHLTSSNFPLWDRNLNTGHRPGMDAEIQVAQQTIYHDHLHQSHIVLPVIDGTNGT